MNRAYRPASASRSQNRGRNRRSARQRQAKAQARLLLRHLIHASRHCRCPRGSRNSPVPAFRKGRKLFRCPIRRPEARNRHRMDRLAIPALRHRTSAACSICRRARSRRPYSRRQSPRRAWAVRHRLGRVRKDRQGKADRRNSARPDQACHRQARWARLRWAHPAPRLHPHRLRDRIPGRTRPFVPALRSERPRRRNLRHSYKPSAARRCRSVAKVRTSKPVSLRKTFRARCVSAKPSAPRSASRSRP